MSLFNVFDIAGSALTAQSVRLNTTASNLANAESGASSADGTYKAKQPVFAQEMMNATSGFKGGSNDGFSSDGGVSHFGAGVKVTHVMESQTKPTSRYEPGNPLANKDGVVFYPGINPVEQITDMISASRSFQNNVDVINTTKTLMNKTLTLGEN